MSARAEALEAYRGLPVPDTTEEHWRFTDLRGFDPDSFTANGAASVARPESMLELDVAGVAYVGEAGIEIERAPEGITFAPLDEAHERLGELVGWKDDKFAAHNAASWQHGLLVHVPKGVELDRPLYIRVANAVEGGSLFWRLLVIAEEGSRFSLVEEYASASPVARRLLERGRRALRRAGRQARVRLAAESLAGDLALRFAPRAR